VSKDLVEGSSPICRILELILHFSDFLGLHSLFGRNYGGAAGVDRGLPWKSKGLLLIFSYNIYHVRITFLTDQRLLHLLSIVHAMLQGRRLTHCHHTLCVLYHHVISVNLVHLIVVLLPDIAILEVRKFFLILLIEFLIGILDSLNLEEEGLHEVVEKLLGSDTLYKVVKFFKYIGDRLGRFKGI
jgi:hypothetical protein